MATINNKLIHFKSKSDFDGRYAATTDGGRTYGDFLGTSIVFIQDAKQIWTHGQFYDANEATLASLGITATAEELNYIDGVTSNVQTQLNEIKESVDSISDPYEINLTNLLSAEDSESISTAIGGIDNLNATVQDNRIIVGTISNGSVSVSIRILGNVTTLYYLLDSLVGLTLNEVAITNTSGTLSKSVTTHSVLTENMVIDSLTSDEITLPLSAAQGKVLATDKQNKTDSNLDTTDKTIVGAINEILPKATGVGKVDPNSDGTGEIFNCYESDSDNFIDANQATGRFAHAEGRDTVASGDRSHAEGRGARATGLTSHAEGDGTRASGDTSHAEGFSTTAAGDFSHAEGYYSYAYGDYSHAEGMQTKASGRYSHAEGWHTEASGTHAHAEGDYTQASGNYSHTEGDSTQTFSDAEHAEGSYNKSYDSDDVSVRVIHSVGIGSSMSDRKNAHEIKFNGDHYVYGVGNFDGTNSDTAQTLQEVINGKQDTLVSGTSIKTINGESLLGSGDIEINVTPDLSDYQTKSDDTLNTTDKTVVGAINEIENRTSNLSTQYPSDGATLTVGTSKEPSTRIDFHSPKPAFELKGPRVTDTSNPSLKYRFALGDPMTTWTEYITLQNQTDDSLQTTNKTVVGAINEINSKPSVGEISFIDAEKGNGEIFNNYDGDRKNIANAFASHAEGYKNSCYGSADHVEGSQNKSQSTQGANHIEGVLNTIQGNGGVNHAEGYKNSLTDCSYSHCEGYFYNLYDTSCTHTEGGGFTNIYLNAEANSNIVYLSKENGWLQSIKTNEELLEYFNHPNLSIRDTNSGTFYDIQSVAIEDYNNIPTIKFTLNAPLSETVLTNAKYVIQRQIIHGNYNHIEGFANYCESENTHIEGNDHTALSGSENVHIEGCANFVGENLDELHVEGYCNRVSNSREHAEGSFNVSNTGATEDLQTRHSVGIGTSPSDRKNAHEIMANGDYYIYGLGGYNGTNAIEDSSRTLQEVITDLINKSNYIVDLDTLLRDDAYSYQISIAIGGWDNLRSAIQAKRLIYGYSTEGVFGAPLSSQDLESAIILDFVNSTSLAEIIINNSAGSLSTSHSSIDLSSISN